MIGAPFSPVDQRSGRIGWTALAAGALALYLPVFYELAIGLWQSDDHAHGPIILAIVVWLMWRSRHRFLTNSVRPALLTGLSVLLFGLLAYVLGRAHDITILEVGALAPIVGGTVLAMRGWTALRTVWFPLLFMFFLVPLPGTLVDAVTGTLKHWVSGIAEHLLYALGYPVGRDGVMLTVGQYQLLVADACSGLNSMFSLSAMGLLYLYVVGRTSWLHNGIVVVSMLPIAFAANIVRVLVLVLVTYHFGDEAGQGFLHGAAGLVLVLAALLMLLAWDHAVSRVLLFPKKTPG